jgi:hypothetical protein
MDRRGCRRSRHWDQLYKRSQLADTGSDRRRRAKTPAEASLGFIVPNEPNLPHSGRKSHCPAGPGALTTLGQSCETNPIPARAIGGTSALRHMSYDNSDTQPASAKQSQFPPGQRWARTGNAADVTRGTQRTKQTQFASHRPDEAPADRAAGAALLGTSVRNEAHFRGQAGATDWEQTMASREAAARRVGQRNLGGIAKVGLRP